MKNLLKRLFIELMKVSPYLAIVFGAAYLLGDTSQLYLTAYWLIVVCGTALVAHVTRKIMYPSFSMESHMKSAWENSNMASALVVTAMLAFQIAICWLVVVCVIAMVASPPKFATALQAATEQSSKGVGK